MSSLAPLPSATSFGRLPAADLEDFVPRVTWSIAQFPVYYMRGGTSTGIVLWHEHVPEDQALKEELIRAIMGVPPCGAPGRGHQGIRGLAPGARCGGDDGLGCQYHAERPANGHDPAVGGPPGQERSPAGGTAQRRR